VDIDLYRPAAGAGRRTAEPEIVNRDTAHQDLCPCRQANPPINRLAKSQWMQEVVSCSNPAITLIWNRAFKNNR